MKKILITIALVAGLSACGSTASESTPSTRQSAKTAKPTKAEAPKDTRTSGQKNAVRHAESYLDMTAFSRKGLIDQLKFEGYSTADATYAVDHVTVNWNEQAAEKAADYLDMTPFSRSGLIDQLKFEGFTTAQATYGADHAL